MPLHLEAYKTLSRSINIFVLVWDCLFYKLHFHQVLCQSAVLAWSLAIPSHWLMVSYETGAEDDQKLHNCELQLQTAFLESTVYEIIYFKRSQFPTKFPSYLYMPCTLSLFLKEN